MLEVGKKSEAWERRQSEKDVWLVGNEPHGQRSNHYRGMAERFSGRGMLMVEYTSRCSLFWHSHARPVPGGNSKLLYISTRSWQFSLPRTSLTVLNKIKFMS